MKTTHSVLAVVLVLAGGHIPASERANQGGNASASAVFDETVARVAPERGFQSRLRLGGSIVELVRHGVIDSSKFENLYAGRGGLPQEWRKILTAPSEQPIHLTSGNANFYVNLL